MGITTVENLLDLSYQSLSNIKNIGKKSIEEILVCQEKLRDYGLQTESAPDQKDIILLHDSINSLNLSVRSTNALNNYGIITIEDLLELKDQTLDKIRNIGKKSIEEIITIRENIKKITSYKDIFEFSNQPERLRPLYKLFKHIPKFRLDRYFCDYLSCINGLDAEFYAMLESIHTINDLPSIFELACENDKKISDFLRLLTVLALDVKKFLNDIAKKIFLNPKYRRVVEVLQKRINGKTLQEISDEIGLTRERIRQIENKGTKLLIKYLSEINLNLLEFINIEYHCEDIMTISELNKYLNGIECLDLFIYILETKRISENYIFNKRLNVFYNNTIIADINAILDRIFTLPDIIEENKKDNILLRISHENKFPLKVIMIEFSNIYKRKGKVYCKDKLSLTRIYDYILEKYYPTGIKLFDDKTIEYFKDRIIETFGDIRVSENNRAIYAKIQKQAVLCDRGTYIHPTYISINKKIIEEIDAFIAASPRKVIPFNELFETFKQELFLHSNINNRYFLQGILNIYLNKKYFFTRDMVSKERNANFTDEVEFYIKNKGAVHKTKLFSEFNGMSQVVFSMRIKNNKNIVYIGNGWYIHADTLTIEQNDYQMKNIIEEYVKNNPVSSRKMLELLWEVSPQFLTKNTIETHEKLFGILQFMFKDDFYFSRPYIGKLGVDEISNRMVIYKYLNSYNSITIPELLELCEEYHLRYSSIRSLIRNLNNEFLRINRETLVRIDDEIDEHSITEIGRLLLEKIDDHGFFVASNIDDYTFFPKIDFEWNPFLLRSIVEKYMGDMIGIIDIPTTDIYLINSVFIDGQMKIDSYESLLRNIVTTENNNEPFKTRDEVIHWLKEQGLIIGNIPRCLLNESILVHDEYGNLIIK
jgi:predicted transcriptional regulator